MCRLDRSPRHQCLVPGSCPMLPGRYLRTRRNTVPLVYSMQSSTEHRKAPECGDEPDGASWVDWGEDDVSQLDSRTKADPGPSEQAVAHPDPTCCRCQGSDAWSG